MAEEAEELLERLRRRLLREVDRILGELEALRRDWTPDGGLRPLYTVYEFPDRYVVLVDLAAADPDTVRVEADPEEGRVIVEARLERELSLSDIYGGFVASSVTLRYYRNEIRLPPDADVSRLVYRLRPDKILEITVPKTG